MKSPALTFHRLHRQCISRQPFDTPEAVVHWMGAMQAQDYLASLWATGLRVSSAAHITEPAIEQAIAARKIIRTWPMRGTLHFVAPEDARWMLKLLTPRVISSSAGRHRELGLDEAIFAKSRNLLEAALQGGKRLERAELFRILEAARIAPGGQRGYHILIYWAQKGLICCGPRQGKQPTFVLLDEWIPDGKAPDPEEALAMLGERYLRSHGPATVYDFAAWAGLTVGDARKSFERVKSIAGQMEIGGQAYWFIEPGMDTIPESPRAWLLPAFDEMLCGYKDRSAILASEHQKATILKNGIFSPVLLLEGKAAGTWKRTLKRDQVLIHISPFTPIDPAHREAVLAAAAEYGTFLGLKAEVELISRS